VNDDIKRGYPLFSGKAGCSACHSIDKNAALFTDHQLHNTGIGYRKSMQTVPETQKVQVAPGVL